jgi:hypothetical protein
MKCVNILEENDERTSMFKNKQKNSRVSRDICRAVFARWCFEILPVAVVGSSKSIELIVFLFKMKEIFVVRCFQMIAYLEKYLI